MKYLSQHTVSRDINHFRRQTFFKHIQEFDIDLVHNYQSNNLRHERTCDENM